MGTKSEARKRFQRNGQYRRQSFQSPRSSSRYSCYSGPGRQSRLDSQRRDGKDDRNHDQLRSQDTRESNPESFLR